MRDERYKRGAQRLNKVNPDGLYTLVQSLESIAPDLARYVIEFAYGIFTYGRDWIRGSGSCALSRRSPRLATERDSLAITFVQL